MAKEAVDIASRRRRARRRVHLLTRPEPRDRHRQSSSARLNRRRRASASCRSSGRTVRRLSRYRALGVATVTRIPSNSLTSDFDRLEVRGIAEAGHHVEEQVGVRRMVPNGRILAEQVVGTNLLDLGVVGIRRPEGFAQAFDVGRRCADEESTSSVARTRPWKPIAVAPISDVLEASRLERAEDANEFISIHGPRVSRDAPCGPLSVVEHAGSVCLPAWRAATPPGLCRQPITCARRRPDVHVRNRSAVRDR